MSGYELPDVSPEMSCEADFSAVFSEDLFPHETAPMHNTAAVVRDNNFFIADTPLQWFYI